MKNNKKQSVDLASLYPTPKTYDELEARKEAARVRWEKRQPKHVALSTSINFSVAVLVSMVIVSNPSAFLYFGAMSGVSFMFLAGLLWFGFVGWQLMRIADFFNRNNLSATPFVLTYFMSSVPLLTTVFLAIKTSLPLLVVYLAIILLNIALILSITKVITVKKLSDKQKRNILIAIVLICILFAGIMTLI